MKIIRCITENNDAIFDNDFATDIRIKEDSKIALHSISFDILENVITIDGANDTFSFNLTNTTPANAKQVVLEHAEYTSNNFTDLLDDMTVKMNNALPYEGKALGTQFLNFIGEKTKKAEIGFKFSPQMNDDFFQSVKNVDQGAVFIRKTDDVNTNDDSSRMSSTAELTKGAGRFQVRLRKIDDSGGGGISTRGLTVGLTETPPAQQTDNINFSHKLKCGNQADQYVFTREGSAPVMSGITIENAATGTLSTNDIMEFAIFEGKLQARVYRSSQAAPDIIHEEPLDRTKSYYPVLSFQGKSSAVEANTIRYHYDPWAYETNNVVSHTGINTLEDYSGFTARPPNVSRNSNTIFNLTLNQSLLEFLGFQQLVNLKRGVEVQIIADNLFKATLLNDSFVVEMLSEKLESFDATGNNGKRRNLLAVVPRNDNDGFVEYEPNTPYFIDMGNTTPKNIRNVKARILRSDLAPINISGIAIMTLLVKDSNE